MSEHTDDTVSATPQGAAERRPGPFYGSEDVLDLDAYLARIGYQGTREPTLATLRGLQRAHVTAIPFENLEIRLGRGIPLDLATLQDKLVRRRRGGYCYEHTLLFATALQRVGFGVTGLHARVTMGADSPRPAAHALLRVTTADSDEPWLCDVGFGRGPLEPLSFAPGVEVTQDGWRYRTERRVSGPDAEVGVERWALYQHGPDGWVERHHFTLEPQYLVDYEVGNHYVSTSPRSPFNTRVFAQRFAVEEHHTLDGVTWTTERPDGARTREEVAPSEVTAVLTEVFGIALVPEDTATLVRQSEEAAEAAATAPEMPAEPKELHTT